jgi:hypothetical protein
MPVLLWRMQGQLISYPWSRGGYDISYLNLMMKLGRSSSEEVAKPSIDRASWNKIKVVAAAYIVCMCMCTCII